MQEYSHFASEITKKSQIFTHASPDMESHVTLDVGILNITQACEKCKQRQSNKV